MEGPKMQDANLHTIARGVLAEQFKDALDQAATVFAEATSRNECPYEAPKDVVTVKVEIEIELSYDMQQQTNAVAARLSVKKPKKRWSVGGIFARNRKWAVADDGEQLPMFGGTVKGLPGRKEGTTNEGE